MTDVLGESRVAGVALSDGSRIDADVVVVGIGVTPNTEWLERSGLTIDNRIVCNGSGEAYDRRIQFIGGGPPHDEIVIVDGSLAGPKTDGAPPARRSPVGVSRPESAARADQVQEAARCRRIVERCHLGTGRFEAHLVGPARAYGAFRSRHGWSRSGVLSWTVTR